jgi:hypothetical protein
MLRVGTSVPDATADSVTVYAQNTAANGNAHVSGMIIKNNIGNTIANVAFGTGATLTLTPGALVGVAGTVTDLLVGTYTATVTNSGGGSFVSSAFVVSP